MFLPFFGIEFPQCTCILELLSFRRTLVVLRTGAETYWQLWGVCWNTSGGS